MARYRCRGCGYVTDDRGGTPCARNGVGCGIGKMKYKSNSVRILPFPLTILHTRYDNNAAMVCNSCGYFYTEMECPDCGVTIIVGRDKTDRKSTRAKLEDKKYIEGLPPKKRELVLKTRATLKMISVAVAVVATIMALYGLVIMELGWEVGLISFFIVFWLWLRAFRPRW